MRIKGILGLVLVMGVLFSSIMTNTVNVFAAEAYAVEGGNIYFLHYGTVGEITDCDDSVTSVVIPSEINGVAVTKIGSNAFSDCRELESVEILSGATEIGFDAFSGCSSLTSVTIPNSVTSIGSRAFAYCTSLTSIEIPSSVRNIDFCLFESCTSLTNVVIPDSIESISDGAFSWCSGLTSIEIPDSVTYIGVDTFRGCSGLTSVEIPSSVETIGYGSFRDCFKLASINVDENNAEYVSIDGVLYNKEKTILLAVPNDKAGIDIPDSVVRIDGRAFSGCYRITELEIPSGVTNIDSVAFESCNGLTDVYYSGSEEEWNKIIIEEYGNEALAAANIHFNSHIPAGSVFGDSGDNQKTVEEKNDEGKKETALINPITVCAAAVTLVVVVAVGLFIIKKKSK